MVSSEVTMVSREVTMVSSEVTVVTSRLTKINDRAPGGSRRVSPHGEAAPPEHGRSQRPTTE
jgi:hypothetical protein